MVASAWRLCRKRTLGPGPLLKVHLIEQWLLKKALRYTGKMGLIASEEEDASRVSVHPSAADDASDEGRARLRAPRG